jgi:hypothetical protein
MSIRLLLSLAGCACALAGLAAPAAAAPKRALAELRVEGPNGTLDPGTWYVTGTERIRRSRPGDNCIRTRGRFRFRGPTALGLPETGSKRRKSLRQVRVRMDEVGPFVCEIGSIVGRPFTHPDGFAGWTYWIDFVAGSSSADLATLKRGDRVLWVFSDFHTDPAQHVNTGDALELRGVPARTRTGIFTVEVLAHRFDGVTSPADGATIRGATSVNPLGGGRYQVEVRKGRTRLKATRGTDIPSNQLRACFRNKLRRCPRAHGRKMIGSARADRLRGTRGDDVIKAGGGPDRIVLRNGGRDRLNCGPGKDTVVVKRRDRDDRIKRNCERVIRKR